MDSLWLKARAATARLELLAFNPHQRRGPDGRWIRMPTSELKRPRRVARNLAKRLLAGPARRLEGAELSRVEELFGFDDGPTGISTRVQQARVSDTIFGSGKELDVEIGLFDRSGQRVGRAKRTFSEGADGRMEVSHDRLSVDAALRGGGFSSRWLPAMEERYRRAGVDRITLQTTGIGGNAWARAGFDFTDDANAQRAGDQVQVYATEHPPPPEVQRRLAALRQRAALGGEDRPLPMEFAMLGWEPGATEWFGRKAMVGTDWAGVKEL